jgi:hypothetical protein
MFTGLVIGSILRPAVLPSHGDQILPAQPAIDRVDDVPQHDRTPLFDRGLSERILVSGRLRRGQKMISSDLSASLFNAGRPRFGLTAVRSQDVANHPAGNGISGQAG